MGGAGGTKVSRKEEAETGQRAGGGDLRPSSQSLPGEQAARHPGQCLRFTSWPLSLAGSHMWLSLSNPLIPPCNTPFSVFPDTASPISCLSVSFSPMLSFWFLVHLWSPYTLPWSLNIFHCIRFDLTEAVCLLSVFLWSQTFFSVSECVHVYVCSVAQSCLTLCDPMDSVSLLGSSVEFSRQEYWSGLPFPTPGDLPDLGIKLLSSASPALQADSLSLFHLGSPQRLYTANEL